MDRALLNISPRQTDLETKARELGEELGPWSTGRPGVGENRLQALLHSFPWDEEQSMSFWGLGFFLITH